MNLEKKLGKRALTMTTALRMLRERDGKLIVETGCAWNPDDWGGAGLSTVVFGDWAVRHQADLWTVDNDKAHLDSCRALTADYAEAIDYTLGDSVEFLRDCPSIDLLYLDSYDYPYGMLLDLYGGKDDLNAAIERLANVPEERLIQMHHELIAPSQRHAEREIRAALPGLHHKSIVLIDDAGLPGGGKARLAKRVLEDDGWINVIEAYQTLWVRA